MSNANQYRVKMDGGKYLTFDFGTNTVFAAPVSVAYRFDLATAERLAAEHGGEVEVAPAKALTFPAGR